jgi:hypothetical protein
MSGNPLGLPNNTNFKTLLAKDKSRETVYLFEMFFFGLL